MYMQKQMDWRYLRILPKSNHQLHSGQVTQFLNKLWGFQRPMVQALRKGQTMFRSIFRRTPAGEVEWYMGIPEDRMQGFSAAFMSAFPQLEHVEVQPHDVDFLQRVYMGTFLKLGQKGDRKGLPLGTLKDGDPLPSILYGMGVGAGSQEEIVLDVVISPVSHKTLYRIVHRAEKAIQPGEKSALSDPERWMEKVESFGREVVDDLIGKNTSRKTTTKQKQTKLSDLDPQDQNRVQSVRRRYTGQEFGFQTWIRLGVCATPDKGQEKYAKAAANARLRSMVSGFMDWNYYNYLTENRYFHGKKAAESIRSGRPPRFHEMILTAPELACLWHIPDSRNPVFQYIPSVREHAQTLKDDELNQGVYIGVMKHPVQQDRQVAIPFKEFQKHFLLTGMTGSGKSSELVAMCDSLIQQWKSSPCSPGFSLIDPAQETIVILLTRMLNAGLTDEQWSKVHYVSLKNSEHPIGLNLLYRAPGTSADDLAEEAMELLKFAYGGDTPQMDRLLRNGLRTLLEDESQAHTIVGLIPLFTDERFRERVLAHVHDSVLRMFWEREFPAIEGNIEKAMGPLLNRLNPFISNKAMRRMFGQREFSLDLKRYMDEGHIFFWDVLGVGKEQMKLAAGFLITQYHRAAQTRQVGSMTHFLIVDEAHKVQIPVEEKIIAEDRKFGLSLGLSTQFVEQFADWLKLAVKNNVQNIFSCAQGTDAAASVAAMTNGYFERSYLQGLPERTVAVYTKINGQPRSLEVTVPPPYMYLPGGKPVNKDNPREVEQATRLALEKARELQARDGRSIKDIDAELDDYLMTKTPLQQEKREEEPESEDDVLFSL
jgi:hypothetical protein